MTKAQKKSQRVLRLAHKLRKEQIMKGKKLSSWSEMVKESWLIIKRYTPDTIQTITYDWFKRELKTPFNHETNEIETKIILVPIKKRIVLRNF